jgi:hypothetical protein
MGVVETPFGASWRTMTAPWVVVYDKKVAKFWFFAPKEAPAPPLRVASFRL